jgi:integrase
MDMPRPRPPNLHREVTRHGRTVWYVRIGGGPRVRLKAAYGSPEFSAEYQMALEGKHVIPKSGAAHGSLAWLFERYRETTAWTDLSLATRRQRENIMAGVLKTAGVEPCGRISRAHIVAGRDRRKDTPAQARNFLDAVRGLFRWALDAGHIKGDPTQGVSNPTKRKGAGFPVWTEDDVTRFEARWPIGTKERVWLAVLLYTGLRRGDAVVLGPEHISDGVATLKTEKSGGTIAVTIPILPALAKILKAGPCGDRTLICGAGGGSFTKESFGNAFREACNAAGVAKSAHGVRKIGATRAAENGATVAELEAIFGWHGGGMASLYTRAADRVHLAKGAISKLVGRNSMSAPTDRVRTAEQNNK